MRPFSLFPSISSLLAEATSNRTYLDQANQSFTFMRDVLFDTKTNIPLDFIGLNGSDSSPCGTQPVGASSGAGVWIEGLSIFNTLDGATKPDEQLISKSYIGAMTTQSWHSAVEILRISDGAGKFRADLNLPRGLGTLYQRTQNTKFKEDLEKYLAVQYNAIVDLSTKNGTDIYSFDWNGPEPTSFDVDGQTTALSGLLPAITLPDTTSMASPTSTPQPQLDPPRKTPVGGIIGGALGGLLLMLLLCLLYFYWRHQKQKQKHRSLPPDLFETAPTCELQIEPFIPQHLPPGIVQGSSYKEPSRSGISSDYTRNSLQRELPSLPSASTPTQPTQFRTSGKGTVSSAEEIPSLSSTTRSPPNERQDEGQVQLLRDMGEALNAINRRLERVEGVDMGHRGSDEPPQYPGSVQG
ncbi:hypothetical protein V5O48_018542 [Marasmius crinis-equi]|uniref:Uncharacterized protein n=1 Tax=Marasmius crinis-equi TaxID=585013 RepID=A0ABR3EKW6_9AGAR